MVDLLKKTQKKNNEREKEKAKKFKQNQKLWRKWRMKWSTSKLSADENERKFSKKKKRKRWNKRNRPSVRKRAREIEWQINEIMNQFNDFQSSIHCSPSKQNSQSIIQLSFFSIKYTNLFQFSWWGRRRK